MADKFDTMSELPMVSVSVPILLIHGSLDWQIGDHHSDKLFNAVVRSNKLELLEDHDLPNNAGHLTKAHNIQHLQVVGAGHDDIQFAFDVVFDVLSAQITDSV